jgi:AcrR family transcriptional regulator
VTEARERLLVAAEECIAEHGPIVPLRDIAVAAGQRNNSAVNYHFGSRDGLIEAVVSWRTEAMEEERLRRLADAAGTSLELSDLVGMLAEPMLTTPYAEGSTHYARFLEQVRTHPAVAESLEDVERWPAVRKVTTLIAAHLEHLPRTTRRQRIAAMSTALFALAADRERDRADGRRQLGADELVRMLTGMLTA